MDARRKEIRRILIGYITPDADGCIVAGNVLDSVFQGFYSGSLSARLFGLKVKKRTYRTAVREAALADAVAHAFAEMGREVRLAEAPGALAVLCYPLLHNPCLLTAELTDKADELLVTFYAARTLRAPLNAAGRFAEWKKKLPEGTLVEEADEKPKREKKKKKS